MVDLVALISICEKAASLGAKAIALIRKNSLSPEEEELLAAAASDGTIVLLTGERIHGPSFEPAGSGLPTNQIQPPAPGISKPLRRYAREGTSSTMKGSYSA